MACLKIIYANQVLILRYQNLRGNPYNLLKDLLDLVIESKCVLRNLLRIKYVNDFLNGLKVSGRV